MWPQSYLSFSLSVPVCGRLGRRPVGDSSMLASRRVKAALRICITLMQIRILLATLMRIRIQFGILLVTLMQIRIMIATVVRIRSCLSLWCGSGCESGSWFPIKGSKPWMSAQLGLYSIHFGLTSANWCGSGSRLALWCGFGFRLGLCLDSDPNPTFHFDADLVSVRDPVPQHWVKVNYDSKV